MLRTSAHDKVVEGGGGRVPPPLSPTGGSEVLGIDLLSRVGQYLWIPIVTAGPLPPPTAGPFREGQRCEGFVHSTQNEV